MKKSTGFVLLAALALAAASFACGPATAPAPTLTPVPPMALPTATSTDPPPTAAPTTPAAPPEPPPTLTLPPPTLTPGAGLAIVSFTVEVADDPGGKQLTFAWETTGAVRAMIWSGATQRFPQAWEVPPSGTHVAVQAATFYPNPLMTLVAYDAADNQVSESVAADWPCTHAYFFASAPAACPLGAASETWAAEQPFEHGSMIWLEEVGEGGSTMAGQILVFYDDGSYEQYQDTWTEGQPESDPSLAPPPGLYQPIRGFGKVWRDNVGVRDGLGWAEQPEQGFTTSWQQQMRESIPSVAFVRAIDGQVLQINGWGWTTGGDWTALVP